MRPDSLIDYTYRIAFTHGATIDGFKADAAAAFPDAGWEIRDRTDAAPGIRRFVEQVAMFLTLVGLTALGVGGVGASEAVTAFLDRKRFDIAILKSLGADGAVGVPGLLPAGDGDCAGRACCWAPRSAPARLTPWPISIKTACRCRRSWASIPRRCCWRRRFGLLSAIVFAVPPLGRAQAIPPASLLRETVAPSHARPARGLLDRGAALPAFVIAALMLLLAPSPRFRRRNFWAARRRCWWCCGCWPKALTRVLRKLPASAFAAAAAGAGRSHPAGRRHRRASSPRWDWA